MFILLASFDYQNSPSKKLLDRISPYGSNQYRMKKVREQAIGRMECFFQAATPDQILIFSEKKTARKVTLELFAKENGQSKESTYNYPKLKKALEIYGIDYEVNTKPANNLANDVYAYAMRRAYETYALTTVILISLPPLEHFTDFDRFCNFVDEFVAGESVIVPKMFYSSWI